VVLLLQTNALFCSSLVEAQSPAALVSRLSLSKRSEGKRTDKKEEGWMKEGLRSHDERKKKSDVSALLRGAFVVVIVVVVVLIVFTRVVL